MASDWLWVELPEGFVPRVSQAEAVNRWLVEHGYEAAGKYPLVTYPSSKLTAYVRARPAVEDEPEVSRG